MFFGDRLFVVLYFDDSNYVLHYVPKRAGINVKSHDESIRYSSHTYTHKAHKNKPDTDLGYKTKLTIKGIFLSN